MPGSPAVGVVIPARNALRFIDEAIGSVLRQTVAVSEIVMVDDGSQDDTAAHVERLHPQVRVLRQAPGGAASARNAGIRATTSPFLAFLDADDVWLPDKLALQLALPGIVEGCAMAFGHCIEFSDPPSAYPIRPDPMPAPSLSALLIARSAFLDIGFLDESLPIGELLEWLSRPASTRVRQETVTQTVFHRRVHSANSTRLTPHRASTYLKILRARHRSLMA